jgi:Kef-type K+ transport system membrane component KefB
MFVAGLELDLHVLGEYRAAAVLLGLLAFAIPGTIGVLVGLALGWSVPSAALLGALVASHTLIVYPTLRDAGLGNNPAVASAVGATVLTDTLALIVLAVVAGSQSESGSTAEVLVKITIGFVVLVAGGLVLLPRLVEQAFRRWGGDPVARYLVVIVALLSMALLAQVFGIEGIVGAFFAGIALNRLVPNEGPSMERVEFFGTAVFVPIFLVSIGLLLDPSVMFTGEALKLAACICAAALGGKLIACWLAGSLLGFSRAERGAMFVLTAPQAAATLAVTLIGFEIGLFGTTVVNAVLVLIVVSIVLSAVLTDRVIRWMPTRVAGEPRLGANVALLAASAGPSDAAVRAAAMIARPDGGSSELVVVRDPGGPSLDRAALRAIEHRIARLGFEGYVRSEIGDLSHAVERATLAEHSLVVVDDPGFGTKPTRMPLLVVDGGAASPGAELLLVEGRDGGAILAEVQRRLVKAGRSGRFLDRFGRPDAGSFERVTVRGADGQDAGGREGFLEPLETES